MTSALKRIETYFNAKSDLFSLFDVDGYLEIVNNVKNSWHFSSESISFLDDEEEVYGYEYAAQVGKTIDGIQMFYVQENGEKYYVLFDLKNHLTEEEAEDKLGW